MRWLLILGSNRDPEAKLREGAARIADQFTIVAAGSLHWSDEAAGVRYANQGMIIDSGCAIADIRERLRQIEADAGRERGRGDGACALDVDLVAAVESNHISDVLKPKDLQTGYARRILSELRIVQPSDRE